MPIGIPCMGDLLRCLELQNLRLPLLCPGMELWKSERCSLETMLDLDFHTTGTALSSAHPHTWSSLQHDAEGNSCSGIFAEAAGRAGSIRIVM